MTKKQRILLLIDCQIDFISGSLACNGSDKAMDALASYIVQSKDDYDLVVLTADWHPATHSSFIENGGPFPVHCLQHSAGASIYQPILDALHEIGDNYVVLTKGDADSPEQFSIVKNDKSWKELNATLGALETKEIDVAGIAGMYCVKDSISDLHKERPDLKIRALLPYIGHLKETDAEEFRKWVEQSHESTELVEQ